MRLFSLATLAIASVFFPKTTFAAPFTLNPVSAIGLRRECNWKYEDLGFDQKNCVLTEFDPSESTSWVSFANNELHLILTVLKMNPIGEQTGYYFYTDILTWARLFTIKICGANFKEIVQDFGGIKMKYRIFLELIGLIRFNLKVLSNVPKIGPFLKKLSDGLEKPYDAFKNLEKNVYDKCDDANKIVSEIFRILDFLWYVQMMAYIIDDIIIPAGNTALCSVVNTKVTELIAEGAICHTDRLNTRNRERSLLDAEPKESARAFKKAFDDRRDAFVAIKTVADTINSTITIFNDIVEPIQQVMNPIGDALEDVIDEVQPFVRFIEDSGLGGLLKSMGDVLKYFECSICSDLMALIEDGIKDLLKAAGFSFDEFVEELLDPVYDMLPGDIFNLELDAFDFLGISDAAEDVKQKVDEAINATTEIVNLARSVFDPSIDAAKALEMIEGGGDKTYFTTSENGVNVTFSCPSKTLPVVVSAQHTKYTCTEDLSAYMRFPCDGNECTVTYNNVVLCPDNEPAGFSAFPGVTSQILHTTYICFPDDKDPKDLGIVNDLQQYTLNEINVKVTTRPQLFPISENQARKFDATQWANIERPSCTLDRVIELDHWDSMPLPELAKSEIDEQGPWNNRGGEKNRYYTDLAGHLFQKKQDPSFDPTDPMGFLYSSWIVDETHRVFYSKSDKTKPYCKLDDVPKGTRIEGPYPDSIQDYNMWPKFIKECDNFQQRKDELELRISIVDEYIELFNENVEFCTNNVIPICRGRRSCLMEYCQRMQFDYACVFKPDFSRQILTFAFTESRNPNSPVKEVSCEDNRKIHLVKAEIGRGFDVTDVTSDQREKCETTECTVDPDFLATKARLHDAEEPQTVRVETYCECPAGFEPEPLTDGTCVPCVEGAYRADGMSTCQNCPDGTHSKSVAPFDDCVPCEKGTYNNVTGSTRCELCPPGTYNLNEGAISINACLAVPLSHISFTNRSGYVECDEGFGNYPENREECLICGEGYIRPQGAALCTPCEPGFYSNGTASGTCTPTVPGTYQARSAQAGFALAPENYYVDSAKAVEPLPCPDGQITGRKGANSSDLCFDAPSYPNCAEFSSCDDLLAFLNVTNAILGDGFCYGDPRWCVNTDLCNFDGGDCCPETCVPAMLQLDDNQTEAVEAFPLDYFEYSCHPDKFRCLAPRNLTAIDCDGRSSFDPVEDPLEDESCEEKPSVWGNGVCDVDQNYANCNYDGGDCCMSTCNKTALEGSCSPSTLRDCRDPSARIDTVAPILHNLPEARLELRCEAIPQWAPVSATDNDICFDGVVLTEEVRHQVCGDWEYIRRWNSTDPSNNTINFTQTIQITKDDVPPLWHNFPPDLTQVFLDQPSLHPDVTGWPQVTEECSMPVSLTWHDNIVVDKMQCGGERLVNRTWTAVDKCGNTAKRSQRINVKVTNSSVTFSEAWNLQLTAVGGDLKVDGSPSVVEGAVGSSGNVKLHKSSVATGGCAQAAAPYSVVTGSSIDAKNTHFDQWHPRPIYYAKSAKVEKSYEQLAIQEEIFDWMRLETLMGEISEKFSQTSLLGGLFDGPLKQVCEEAEVPCTTDNAGSEALSETTAGVVTRGLSNITLSGVSPYLNVFDMSITDFLVDKSQDDITWMLDAPSTAILIVNVRGPSPGAKSSKKTKQPKGRRLRNDQRYYFKPPVFVIGKLRAEQILVNLPDVDGNKISLEGQKYGVMELPFSLLAPGLDLDLRYVYVKGQVVVKKLSASNIHSSCTGLWWGNAPCEDANLELDGGWRQWDECKECMRERTCSSPHPAFGGQECNGERTEPCPCSPSQKSSKKKHTKTPSGLLI